MSVFCFHCDLRRRLNRMADEHMRMQEAIMDLPAGEIMAALDRLEAHSSEMSRLAGMLKNFEDFPTVSSSES